MRRVQLRLRPAHMVHSCQRDRNPTFTSPNLSEWKERSREGEGKGKVQLVGHALQKVPEDQYVSGGAKSPYD